ncbi:MAG: hypothetical protein MdMp024_0173 [Bacteroidales bacterium]
MKAIKYFVFLLFCLAAGVPAFADGTINMANPSGGSGWTVSGNVVTITADGSYTVTGTTAVYRIVIDKVTATVTLQNANIHSATASPFMLSSDNTSGSQVTLILTGSNEFVSTHVDSPGLQVEDSAQLTIEGNGSLLAQGAGLNPDGGAGIGGGSRKTAGSVIIKSGTITATGGIGSAGIGGGYRGDGGNITITGGTITATGGVYAAGIGGGFESDGGNIITIRGGVVVAVSLGGQGGPAGIGGGGSSNAGTVTITGGTVYASGGSGAGIGGGAYATEGVINITGGTVIADDIGIGAMEQYYESRTATNISGANTVILSPSINTTTFGGATVLTGNNVNVSDTIIADDNVTDVTLNAALTIPSGATLIVPAGIVFDVNYKTLTNNGIIRKYGSLINMGTLTGNPPTGAIQVQDIPAQAYTGDSLKPAVTVTDGNFLLTPGGHYSVAYTNNVNAGTATATVTDLGDYRTVIKTFTIVPQHLAAGFIQDIPAQTYTGDSLKPAVVVWNASNILSPNTDYSVAWLNNVNVGTATVTITGRGNYTGTASKNFLIEYTPTPGQITAGWIQDIPAQTYTGDFLKPAVVVKDGSLTLAQDVHYTCTWMNNVNAGTATVTVSGVGIYTGTASKNFTISPKTVAGDWLEALPAQTYTGQSIQPVVTVRDGSNFLSAGFHYTVAWLNNINAGTAMVTINGLGNYTGAAYKYFTISPKPFAGDWIEALPAQTYTGFSIEPAVTVRDGNNILIAGIHYSVAWLNNINAGTATVTVTGTGNYSGAAYKTFTISPKPVANSWLENIPAQTYTGDSIKPAITVRDGNSVLTAGVHYSVAYMNNVNAGTATVTITGLGNYTGTATGTFNIVRNAVTIEASWVQVIPDQYYTGYSVKPTVVVAGLTLNVDYTVSYYNNIEAGTAVVVITGIGNYTGAVSKPFRIIATGIAEAENTALRIVSENNGIFISGLTPGETFGIYTLQGQPVYESKASSPEEHIYLQDKGVYILRHKGKAYKFYR